MALTELELKRCERDLAKFLEQRRPPVHIRPELDFGYRMSGQSVEILEIRPDWRDQSVIHKRAFAKATFVRTANVWRIYWMRSDLKWHSYKPRAQVRSLEEFLAVVDADEYGCFFG